MTADKKYTYYTVQGEDFCIESEFVFDFELQCNEQNIKYKKVATSNSIDSLRAFCSMKPIGFEHFNLGKN